MQKITINGISLDPDSQEPRLRSLALSSSDARSSSYILIQVSGPLSTPQRKELEQLGAELLEYVPNDTYVARFMGDDLSAIQALQFVDWANTYLKGFKVAPELMDQPQVDSVELMALADDDPIAEGYQRVDIVFHVGAQPSRHLEDVARAAGLDAHSLQPSGQKIRTMVDRTRLRAIAALDEVRHIEKVFDPTLSNDVAIGIMRTDVVHQRNPALRGAGQIVAVCDTGFDVGKEDDVHPAFTGRVTKLYALGRTGTADDPHGHGTHVAGSILGDGNAQNHGQVTGSAPQANLVLQSVLDSGGSLGGLPADLRDLFRPPYHDDDARIHSNSWGTGGTAGRYTASSWEIDDFVWNNRDLVICFAAGNPGRDSNSNGVIDLGSVEAPGTAKNCITIGASESNRPAQSKRWAIGSWQSRYPVDPIASDLWADNPAGMAAFSGRGPTRDGRIKPDVVAPGTSILSAHSRNANVGSFWGASPDSLYCYMGGTSMATPLVSGCAAIVREFLIQTRGLVNPSAALIKAMLINGAVDLLGQYVPTEAGQFPNFSEGFGRVDLERTLSDDQDHLILHDEDQELSVGEERAFSIENPIVGASAKCTLVWTDRAGDTLENDLDLIVRLANEERHGNQLPESTGFDRTNNVEQVVWQDLPAGKVEVIVRAHRTPLFPQSFALVVRFE